MIRANEALRFVPRAEIDTVKWDRCIESAPNGRVYGFSYYLDAACTAWDGLVMGDYEAVMPLPWRAKWSWRYLYHPFAVAQLGMFGNDVDAATLRRFLEAVPRQFRYWDFPLNAGNRFSVPGYPLYERQNFVLPLHHPYETLWAAYRENVRRNVKKSQRYGCAPVEVGVEEVLALTQFQPKPPAADDINRFQRLFAVMKERGQAAAFGVRSNKGELLASCVFFFSHNRAYYILVGNHPNGRTLGASHALIDAFVQQHAGQNLVLDFEGSDVRNLAFFYSSFGAVEERYSAIRLNRLPWWAKWLKQD